MSSNGNDLGRQRPYAAPANVLSVIGRIRSRNLPERIDADFHRLSGVPEGAIYRVVGAMRFLGLADEEGRPSDALRALAAAPEEQYRELLEGIVREAYREDFERVNPAEDSQAQIVRAFQPYQPRSQTNRMVILFLALCREAGIQVLDAPRERAQATRPRTAQVSARVQGTGRTTARGRVVREPNPGPVTPSGLLFGITEEDVAVLGEDEFNAVWTALGQVARARARAKHPPERPAENGPDESDEQEDQP
jgi:hypothetical protein